MKHLRFIAAALTAILLVSSCSILGLGGNSNTNTTSTTATPTSIGSSTGSALIAIYNVLKSTGIIDLSNLTNIINLGQILTGATSLSNATSAYADQFASGLIAGSNKAINESNVASVMESLKSLSSVNAKAINKAASNAYAGNATTLSATAPGVNQTLSTLNDIFATLK